MAAIPTVLSKKICLLLKKGFEQIYLMLGNPVPLHSLEVSMRKIQGMVWRWKEEMDKLKFCLEFALEVYLN